MRLLQLPDYIENASFRPLLVKFLGHESIRPLL